MSATNAVVVTNVKHNKSQHDVNTWSQYCINTWKSWCNKNNVNLRVITEHDENFDRPIWNRYNSFDLFDDDRILMVDSDTMVRWDCPNPFDEVPENTIGCVLDNWNLWWLHQSITAYSEKFFPSFKFDLSRYINGGVLLFTRGIHWSLFNEIKLFYSQHKEELSNWSVPNTGRDQTILNYHIQKFEYKQTILDHTWDQHSMMKFDLFQHNWMRPDLPRVPHFLKTGKIWHFNGFSIENRANMMQQTWNATKNNYE